LSAPLHFLAKLELPWRYGRKGREGKGREGRGGREEESVRHAAQGICEVGAVAEEEIKLRCGKYRNS
jgi:hypothetical protein